MPTPNQVKLEAFVAARLERAAIEVQAGPFLEKQAAHVERQLRALSDWAGAPISHRHRGPMPKHLVGLTAFDLSDALDRLNAAAARAQSKAA